MKLFRILIAIVGIVLAALLLFLSFNAKDYLPDEHIILDRSFTPFFCGILTLLSSILLLIGRNANILPVGCGIIYILASVICITEMLIPGIVLIVLGLFSIGSVFVKKK